MGKPSILQRIVDWGMSLLDGSDSEQPIELKAVRRHKLPERADATIARVRQVNETSCGVAAAAMFARQSHDDVKAFMFPKPKRSYGTHYKDVWRALKHFGVEHQRRVRKFRAWEDIPSDALMCIRWKNTPERQAYHWVIFQRLPNDKFRLIDPGSHASTLASIDLDAFDVLDYSLVTPRTSEQGPFLAPKVEAPRRAAKVRAKKRTATTAKAKK